MLVVNGARATNNNFRLDGVDNNESQFGQIAIYPNPDAIAEFKIESSVPQRSQVAPAEGLSRPPLSLRQRGAWDSRGGVPRPVLSAAGSRFDDPTSPIVPNTVTHNYYGTVGGPIFLPKPREGGSPIYDGRNRSFSFFR